MKDEIEVPRRGYDTKDVETMTRDLDVLESASARKKKTIVLVLLIVAAVVAMWLIATR
jgi:hypothetical protein